MAATALVQSKIEPELKSVIENIFMDIGIDTSTAIRMFLKKVAQLGRIPFILGKEMDEEPEPSYIPNAKFAAFLRNTREDIKAGRNLIHFDSADDAIAHLRKRMKKC